MLSADKVPDQLGHLILNEDGAVVSSAGELENNEHVAGVIYNMLSLSDKLDSEPYHSLSVIYEEGHGYVVTISNKKIYIVKRRFKPPKQLSEPSEVVTTPPVLDAEPPPITTSQDSS